MLNVTIKDCVPCPKGFYQDKDQQTVCLQCPPDTSTKSNGASSRDQCTNSCRDYKGETSLCDRNANCWFIKETNSHTCKCKEGYSGDGQHPNQLQGFVGCRDNCEGYCKNQGECLKVRCRRRRRRRRRINRLLSSTPSRRQEPNIRPTVNSRPLLRGCYYGLNGYWLKLPWL